MFARFFRSSAHAARKRSRQSHQLKLDGYQRRPLGVEHLEERWVLAATLPAGFTDTTVIAGLTGATTMEFSPDGRLWAVEQGGRVKLVRNDGTTFTALQLNVDANGERGLLGIAFDPNFTTNHYAYLYYTNPNNGTASWSAGVHNQLSRFTVNDANPLQPTFTAEAPILDFNKLGTATNHNAGAIHFGADGMLYANTGDNVQSFTGPNGISYRVSQTLDNLLGKQLRIDVAKFNSGLATRNDMVIGHLIPANNPFVGVANGINQLIYVLGLRNPFTFAVQPGTGRMLINDVGETNWEEVNEVVAGANYGWSGGTSDGFGHPQPSFAPGVYRDPVLAYAHNGAGSLATGAAVVGSTFYNPATVQFPASYVGMYFYEDLSSGWIRYFNPNNPNAAANPDGNSVAFATNTPGALRDLKVDAVGNLYFLSGNDGSIHKISYQSPKINTQPANQAVSQGQPATFSVAASGPGLSYQWQHLVGATWTNTGTNSATLTINNVQAVNAGSYRVVVTNTFGTTTSATATLTVSVAGTAPTFTTQPISQQANAGAAATFTVAASGAAPLSYQWQHQVGATWVNVGANSATYTIAAVVTADAGNYRVIASNPNGTATSNAVTLTINQLPTVTITAPTASTMYNWAQSVTFAGSAIDPEDGTLAASKLSWEIRFYHQDSPDGTGLHFHPFQTFTGVAGGTIVTSFPETLQYVWYRFTLTATDSKGATSSKFVDIRPNLQSFTVQSNPAGLQLVLDGGPIASGTIVTGTIGQPRTIGVASPQTLGGTTYAFASWSDGGAASHTINIPTTNTTYTANFAVTSAPPLSATYSSNAPTTLTPGQTVNYTVTVTNTGTQTWSATGATFVRLGAYFNGTGDGVGAWQTEPLRYVLPGNVAPGASATINVSITAPTAPGTYTLRNRLVQEQVAWFTEMLKTTVVVGAAQALSATYSSNAPTTLTPGQTVNYAVTVTNTGSQTWSATGATFVRLGAYFNGTGDGVGAWQTEPLRYVLPGNVAPGASATINVSITAPTAPGTYTLRNRLVQEQVAWFTEMLKTTIVVGAAQALSATYSSNAPTTLTPGQTVNYAVTVTNTGSQTWSATGATFVRLGAYFNGTGDGVGAWQTEPLRYVLPGNVAPGASATINVSITAPTAPGTYTLRNRLVQEQVAWFTEMLKTTVVVGAAQALSATYFSNAPTTLTPGQTANYAVTVTNTGSQTWSATGATFVRLGAYFNGTGDAVGAWQTEPVRYVLPGNVAPGASATINVSITAPTTPGTYTLRNRLVQEQVAWFTDILKTTSVVGTPPALSAVYSNNAPLTLTAGQTVTYTLTATNTGTQTWNATGTNNVRLGAYFNGTSDAVGGWQTEPLRYVLPNDVAPGATVSITVTITAPTTPGTYVLRNRLVKENVSWFAPLQTTTITIN